MKPKGSGAIRSAEPIDNDVLARSLAIGFSGSLPDSIRHDHFFGAVHLGEFDRVIVDPLQLHTYATPISSSNGYQTLDARVIDQRRTFLNYLEIDNGNLIIIVRPPMTATYNQYPSIYLGNSWLMDYANPNGQCGEAIEPAKYFEELLAPLENSLVYTGLPDFDPNHDIVPLFQLRRTKRCAGGAIRIGHGVLCFVPAPKPNSDLGLYLSVMLKVPDAVRALLAPKKTSLPDWSSEFRLARETEGLVQIADWTERIKAAEAKIEQLGEVVASERELKHLFCSQGDAFHDAVELAFGVLGFTTSRTGASNICDLLVMRNGRLAVIEAKGLGGSGRGNDVRQCKAWHSQVRTALATPTSEASGDTLDYCKALEELGLTPGSPEAEAVDPHAILAINTFWDRPPPLRPNADWPNQAIGEAQRDSIALVTGLQLLAMVEAVRDGTVDPEKIADTLLDTAGAVIGYDWRTALKFS